jgi:hypothetical protein
VSEPITDEYLDDLRAKAADAASAVFSAWDGGNCVLTIDGYDIADFWRVGPGAAVVDFIEASIHGVPRLIEEVDRLRELAAQYEPMALRIHEDTRRIAELKKVLERLRDNAFPTNADLAAVDEALDL